MKLTDLYKLLDGNADAQAALVDLCDAYTDFVDGEGAHDIVDATGVTIDRADRMVDIGTDALCVIQMDGE